VANPGEVYKCNICGNIVYVMEGGGGDLVCCGEDMVKLKGDEAAAFTRRVS
jgi:superoxide reductase